MDESPGGCQRWRERFAPVDRLARAQSRAQSAPPSGVQLPAFVAVAQSNSGSPPDILSFSKQAWVVKPGAFPLSAKRAAPTGANKIAEEDHPLPPNRAPSGTPYTLPPSVSPDTERLHSRKNRDARYAPVWLRLQAKVARKFHADPVN